MPLSKYNRYFGGKKNAASKAHAAMVEQYGAKKGEQVFYATKNKHAGGKRDEMMRRFQAKHRGKKRGR
jgi:hypothetical protein